MTDKLTQHPTKSARSLSPQEVMKILQERFPKTFPLDSKEIQPLKVGIHLELIPVLLEQCSKHSLREALRIYTRLSEYIDKLKLNAPRIDLEGNPCGEVTEDESKNAVKLKEREIRSEINKQLYAEAIPGELEITVKIKEKPSKVKVTKKQHCFFVLTPEKQEIRVMLSAKTWASLENETKKYQFWIAVFNGKLTIQAGMNQLIEPNLQVFDSQQLEEQPVSEVLASDTSSPPVESIPMPPQSPIKKPSVPTEEKVSSSPKSVSSTKTPPSDKKKVSPPVDKQKGVTIKPPPRPILSLKKKSQ